MFFNLFSFHERQRCIMQPLMLVNNQKSGHVGQGSVLSHRFCLAPQTPKISISQQPHSNLGMIKC